MTINKDFAKGLAKVKEKDWFLAIDFFNSAIEDDGSNIEYYAERAIAYLHTKQYDLSMFDMNKSIELDSNYAYRYSCRAYLKSTTGDMDGAIADYQKAIELDPKDAVVHNNLGLMQEKKGYHQKAKKSFDKSNELIGYDPNKERKNDSIDKLDEKTTNLTKGKIVKDVFTKKNSFKEFIGFIGNGFKLKEDDEKRKK